MGLLSLLSFFRRGKNDVCKYARKIEFDSNNGFLEWECIAPENYSCEYRKRVNYQDYLCKNKKFEKK